MSGITIGNKVSGAGQVFARPIGAMIGACCFALLTALAAQIRVPLPGTAVPMTLQTLLVLMTGYCLSPRAAAASMGMYLVLGLVGLPVFAGGIGAAALFGITGGYAVGFVPAAWIVSRLRGEFSSVVRLTLAGVAGTAIVFACGVGWFAIGSGDLRGAIAVGFVPFLPGAIVKLMLAVVAVRVGLGLIDRGTGKSGEVE